MGSSTDTPTGYVAQTEWPTLQAMADGFSEHLMPASSKLEGKSIEHTYINGWRIRHDFQAESLTWAIVSGGEDAGKSGTEPYKAYEVRAGIFLIDFYKESYKELVSLLYDESTGQVKVCLSGFKDNDKAERRTYTVFLDATHVHSSNDQKPLSAFPETTELIGKQVLYRYTPRDAYHHLYLNSGTLTWHCVAGTEKDIADTEQARYWKLSDSLYILFWTETVMPVESIVVIDLKEMRSTGRFLCWDPKPQAVVHVRFGSQATLLAEVDVEAELRKPLRKS
ncbi:molybdenum cofactor biosynthesis protein F [Microdochium bolleyi]|uniref:Molybdenum cofactor biosynthesis protein F n=1 Tax=Microdochium bolleyi TaxID=196109 RepID=A0A136IQ80_9PEZI|nr:molybdenum cofactor biosynthesis protein F [Microdochium bolleyi]